MSHIEDRIFALEIVADLMQGKITALEAELRGVTVCYDELHTFMINEEEMQ